MSFNLVNLLGAIRDKEAEAIKLTNENRDLKLYTLKVIDSRREQKKTAHESFVKSKAEIVELQSKVADLSEWIETSQVDTDYATKNAAKKLEAVEKELELAENGRKKANSEYTNLARRSRAQVAKKDRENGLLKNELTVLKDGLTVSNEKNSILLENGHKVVAALNKAKIEIKTARSKISVLEDIIQETLQLIVDAPTSTPDNPVQVATAEQEEEDDYMLLTRMDQKERILWFNKLRFEESCRITDRKTMEKVNVSRKPEVVDKFYYHQKN